MTLKEESMNHNIVNFKLNKFFFTHFIVLAKIIKILEYKIYEIPYIYIKQQ